MPYAPTMPGMDTSGVGVSNVQALTLFDAEPFLGTYSAERQAMTPQTAPVPAPAQGNPALVFAGLILAFVAMGYVVHESEHLRDNIGFLFTPIAVVSAGLLIFIVLVATKTFFSMFPVPGVTQLIHAA